MEIWKPVVGYESLYEVSSFGRIKTLARFVQVDSDGIKAKDFRQMKIIKPAKSNNKNGYFCLNLHRKGIKKYYTVHCLVAYAFIGPRPEGMEINHKDGNKLNNKSDNLEYVSPKENTSHAIRVGLWSPIGSKNKNSRLKESDIVSIRKRYASGQIKQKTLAREYNVKRLTIYRITKNKSWTHV